jgi:hypothetical protein
VITLTISALLGLSARAAADGSVSYSVGGQRVAGVRAAAAAGALPASFATPASFVTWCAKSVKLNMVVAE